MTCAAEWLAVSEDVPGALPDLVVNVHQPGATPAEAEARAQELVTALKKVANPPTIRVVTDPAAQKQVWAVREAALGASARLPRRTKEGVMSQERVEPEFIRRTNRPVAIWLLIGAILLVAMVVDYLARWPYVMTPLYALAVLVAAWRQEPGEATITAIVANLINAASGVIQGTPPMIWLLYSSGLIFTGVLAVLVSIQRQHLQWREREVTQAHHHLALQYVVARSLAEAVTLREAQLSLLKVIGEHSGWAVGLFWSPDSTDSVLICRAIWHHSGVETPEFDALSRRTPMPRDVGLPGRIWASGETTWVPDVLKDVNFPREQAAAKAGLHSAFGFPIRSGSQILGVMSFFRSEIREPDPAVLEMFTAIASQIGQFMERKRAEEDRAYLLTREQAARAEADAQRARLETVLSSAPAGIIVVDVKPGHLTANLQAADLFGHAFIPESGTAQYSEQVRTPDGAALPQERLPSSRALKGQTVQNEELLVVQPNGRRIPILISAAPICENGGGITGAVVTFEDTSVIKDLERMREEWVSLIAHDLRQPVTVITGYAQFLQRLLTKHASPENEQKAVENVLVSARNLDRMVSDLLDASRIETRRLKLERQSVDFPALVRGVIERATAIMRGHPVRLEVKGEIPRLDVDPGRIEQVLGNLLSNAAKYSYPDTEILGEVARIDGQVRVSVADQGEGIATDELPKLFTRFFRTREARGGGVAGLGLGLYISKRLVEAHGGRMWAESVPGETTTFCFTLPVPISSPEASGIAA